MENSIQTLRFLGIDMINKANSGHPGIVLGAAATLYELYHNHLNALPDKPNWFNRDRFFLAAGHGSALLYSMLHLTGYKVSLDDLKQKVITFYLKRDAITNFFNAFQSNERTY